jgi:WD40 repeat protein
VGTEGIVRTLAEPGHAAVTSVTFSPDGKLLAVAGGTLGKTFIRSISQVTSS